MRAHRISKSQQHRTGSKPVVAIEALETRALFSAALTTLTPLPAISAADPSGPSQSVNGTLVSDSAGNLYGVQPGGGADGYGLIFKIDATTHAFSVVHTFEATDGSDPTQLAIDSSGNLFGITADDYGGGVTPSVSGGTLFELPGANPASFKTLETFDQNELGSGATALTLDASGNAYVLLADAGRGYNAIAKVTPSGDASQVGTIYSFDTVTDGTAAPLSLTLVNGNFYGTTLDGGDNSQGSLFELPAGQSQGVTLASFTDATTGSSPYGTPYVDASGNVYGLAENGGANGYGVVYEYNASTQSLDALTSFDGNTFAHPEGNVLPDGNGNLLATTSESGGDTDYGTVFNINTSAGAVTQLADFTSPDGTDNTYGSTPITGLTAGTNGLYYGVDSAGGANGAGVVYELNTTGVTTPSSNADLSATIEKSTLPADIVSGSNAKGVISLSVSNSSSNTIKATDTITVYASTTGVIDGASTQIASITKPFTLKPGASKPVRLLVKNLSLPAGSYSLLAQASDASGTYNATVGPTLQVAAPYVSLAASVGAVTPATVTQGKKISFVVTLTNNGNIDSSGAATFAISLMNGPSTTPLDTVTFKSLKIKAGGKPTKVRLHAIAPSPSIYTSQYPVVAITQGSESLSVVGTIPFSLVSGS